MELKDLSLPEDIKKMNVHDLELTAVAIREFLIENVSKTGGHLASNLGIVEITLGMFKEFDPPRDKFIYDVGHQSYVHKILSGRLDEFKTLRQEGGMSGFPKRRESEFDVYETGHSSTAVSAALGMAAARDLRGEDYEVVALVGDGALTGGPAYEGLNNLGTSGRRMIVIFNDNGMSISPNTGGVSKHFAKLRASSKYRFAKDRVKSVLYKLPVGGEAIADELRRRRNQIKYMLIEGGVIFEEMGLKYLGPFDGNDMQSVLEGLELAKRYDQPVIVHFITKKGRGYFQAEKTPEKYHGIGPFDPETGIPLKPPEKTYSQVFGEAVFRAAHRNENVVAISAAMTDATGLSTMKKFMPERVFDVGIAEAHAVIFAAGMAASGLKPVVAIYSSFLQRAYDEILEDVCLQDLHVVFAIDRAGIVGQDGETHHGIFDISYLSSMPNMTILAPCDASQLREMIDYAINVVKGPVAVRYPRGAALLDQIPGYPFKGKNFIVREGDDICILAVGTMLKPSLDAADILSRKGISAEVVNVGAVRPFEDSVLPDESVPLLTVEDNVLPGGFGEYIKAAYDDRTVENVAWPDEFIEHGSPAYLYHKYGLDAEGIARAAEAELEKRKA
ncbi:MAG: 1-deoxy-D-xylulose-5-phosphate synthase [Eubacterium sp.]